MELNSKDKYNNKYGIYKNNNSYIEILMILQSINLHL